MSDNKITRRGFIKRGLTGALAITPLALVDGCAGKRIDLTEEMYRIDQHPERKAENQTYLDAYDFENCVECGECLRGCIYKNLDEDQAIENIIKMRAGDTAVCEAMLDQCILCYKCNERCPVDARPAALMLQRLKERREREGGVPASMKYFINGMKSQGWDKNLFVDLYSDHSREEREIIEKWSGPKDCGDGDLLWCSCAVRIFPYDIEHSRALADLRKFGGKFDCCGLASFRSGLFDVSRYLVNNLIDRLSECRFKRLVVMCGSCQEMFKICMPEYLGQEFPFEVISIYEYLEERIKKGELAVQRQVPVEQKENACISHACFGHDFGEEYTACVKNLARLVGFDCVELEHTGENNACCGMGGYYRKGNLWDIVDVQSLKEKDLKKSKAENIVSYCYGCYFTTHFLQGGTSHFLLEKLLWALGDEIKYPLKGIFGRSLNFRNMWHMMGIGPSALF